MAAIPLHKGVSLVLPPSGKRRSDASIPATQSDSAVDDGNTQVPILEDATRARCLDTRLFKSRRRCRDRFGGGFLLGSLGNASIVVRLDGIVSPLHGAVG